MSLRAAVQLADRGATARAATALRGSCLLAHHPVLPTRLLPRAWYAPGQGPAGRGPAAVIPLSAHRCMPRRSLHATAATARPAGQGGSADGGRPTVGGPRLDMAAERPLVLGIESSFDDTAVALVTATGRVLGDARVCQRSDHANAGGTIPVQAGRLHAANLPYALADALAQAATAAGVTAGDIDAIACTQGPGLSPCLDAGLSFAKGLSRRWDLPLIPVHHMEAHALTPRLDTRLDFPYLVLLASGGHCLLMLAEGVGSFRRLGTTTDDAPGEAYDKVARALGLDGGGSDLERCAAAGDASAFAFPIPLRASRNCDFSFSGIKSSVMRAIQQHCRAVGGPGSAEFRIGDWRRSAAIMRRSEHAAVRADIAASFQHAVCIHIQERVHRAIRFADGSKLAAACHADGGGGDGGDRGGCGDGGDTEAGRDGSGMPAAIGPAPADAVTGLVLSGGVACNAMLRERITRLADVFGLPVLCPSPALCVDNGVMIAWAGVEYHRIGRQQLTPDQAASLRYTPKWPFGTDARAEVAAADIRLPNTRVFKALRRPAPSGS